MSSPSASYMMISEIKLVTCVSFTCINKNMSIKLKVWQFVPLTPFHADRFYYINFVNSCCLVFHQGDEGTSWYIIYKGSVNVIVHGKVYKIINL